jgi:hypothetical protein
VHPSEAEVFDWDEGNEEELSNHAISGNEVEQVFANGPVFAPNKRYRAGDWKMLGAHRRRTKPDCGGATGRDTLSIKADHRMGRDKG